MKDGLFKFPSTPHLATLNDVHVRADKVLTDDERFKFLQHHIIVEEKVDGSNLGISFDHEGMLLLQNRGAFLQLPGTGQWKKLEQWLTPKIDRLFEILIDRYILFGEWCYAQHSISYNLLPDWFLGFDLYDKSRGKFLSAESRNNKLSQLRIVAAPFLGSGYFSFHELKHFSSQSRISDQQAEGIYLRIDQGGYLQQRAKLVRSSFIQSVEVHWSRSSIKPNQLIPKVREEIE